MVTNYYAKAGLWPALNALGFNVVGYGCATCIGNSGPLPEEISAAVNDADLAVVSVLLTDAVLQKLVFYKIKHFLN